MDQALVELRRHPQARNGPNRVYGVGARASVRASQSTRPRWRRGR
jgi:hypothetical protein